jgi:hypothetical protein
VEVAPTRWIELPQVCLLMGEKWPSSESSEHSVGAEAGTDPLSESLYDSLF